MQIWAESGKSALPICNYSQILYQFLTFTQNLKRSHLGSTSSESFKRERWVKLRCLYNSRGRCFIPCYYTFFSMFSPILLGT